MVGPSGAADWTDPECVAGGVFEYHYRSAVASTIYGGSSEVLRSLIAEQSLGLPRSRPKTVTRPTVQQKEVNHGHCSRRA